MNSREIRESAVTLHDLVRTGPDDLAGRYLRSFWHPVLESAKLAAGQAMQLRVMGEDWTLYRGEGGLPHLVGFRCAHRNAQLSVGWVEGDEIRCFYHGWKYDGRGQCTEQPAELEPFADRVRLRSASAIEYKGLVFAWFGRGEPPAPPAFPDLEHDDAEYLCYSSSHGFNYFNSIDNLLDATHIGFVHRGQPGGFDGRTDSPKLEVAETPWGATSRHVRPSGRAGQTQFGMPNMLRLRALPPEAGLPPREVVFWIVPVDDENCRMFYMEMVRMPAAERTAYLAKRREIARKQAIRPFDLAEAVVAGRMRREDVDPETTRYVGFVDDVAQLAQGRIHDRTQERLGGGDVGVKLLRSLWLRELAAFREGRPLTEWKYDPAMPMAQADEES